MEKEQEIEQEAHKYVCGCVFVWNNNGKIIFRKLCGKCGGTK